MLSQSSQGGKVTKFCWCTPSATMPMATLSATATTATMHGAPAALINRPQQAEARKMSTGRTGNIDQMNAQKSKGQ